jgi:hypothetical protein
VNPRDDDRDPLRIRPPLLACLRFGLVLMGVVMGVGIVIGEIRKAIDGVALTEPLVLLQLAALAIGLGLAIGLVCYVTLIPWTWTIGAEGVEGRSLWGRRHRIAWNDVANVGSVSFDGIPALLIGAAGRGADIVAYTLGVDLQAIHSRLARHAGTNHPLTRAFAGAR